MCALPKHSHLVLSSSTANRLKGGAGPTRCLTYYLNHRGKRSCQGRITRAGLTCRLRGPAGLHPTPQPVKEYCGLCTVRGRADMIKSSSVNGATLCVEKALIVASLTRCAVQMSWLAVPNSFDFKTQQGSVDC